MIRTLLPPYQSYFSKAMNWQLLLKGIQPKHTNCGPVYEMKNPLGRLNESFAIADMRQIKIASPHYHTNGETEIYFVLEGLGRVVVGKQEIAIEKNSVVIIPPDTAHHTFLIQGLVLAVINTPPFNSKNCIDLIESNPTVNFDLNQFQRLISRCSSAK